MEIFEKVSRYCLENKLLKKDDKIIVAMSGGPDSVSLFHILLAFKEKFGLTLYLAHVNHMLRGSEAEADEKFVEKLGQEYGVECFVKRADVREYARENKIGEEEAGRKIRYSFFESLKETLGADKVALAHNLDDDVETFMFRLMRGTSLIGLEGIPVKRDFYVRPLLNIYKSEILHFLEQNGYGYRTDSSNLEDKYTRNSIRLNLIPHIENNYSRNFKEKVSALMEEIKEVNLILKKDIERISKQDSFYLNDIKEFPEYMKKRFIREYLEKYEIEISRRKIVDILSILNSGGSKEIDLGNGYFFKKVYDYFKVEIPEAKENEKKTEKLLPIPGKVRYNSYIITATVVDKVEAEENAFYIDAEKVKKLRVRPRNEGDFFVPVGMSGGKKLKKFFIDMKLPKKIREEVPIVVSENDIVWVAGIRGSENFKVTKSTKSIVKLKIEEGSISE